MNVEDYGNLIAEIDELHCELDVTESKLEGVHWDLDKKQEKLQDLVKLRDGENLKNFFKRYLT